MNDNIEIQSNQKCWNKEVIKADYDSKNIDRNIILHYIYKPKTRIINNGYRIFKAYRRGDKPDTIEKRFVELSKRWKNETKGLSLSASKINNDNYLAIIGLGILDKNRILKLILQDLQKSFSYWHYALKKISNENPVPKELNNNIPKTRELWLHWGHEKGIIIND